jgi:hypothetical protein
MQNPGQDSAQINTVCARALPTVKICVVASNARAALPAQVENVERLGMMTSLMISNRVF